MKAFRLLIGILYLALLSFQNQDKKKFHVQIFFESNMTPGVKYILNQDRLKVLTSSDFQWRSSNLVFSKALSAKQSDTIYSMIKNLKLDTLKSSYIYDTSQGSIIHDELYAHFIIYGDSIKLSKTTTCATTTLATDSLISIIKSKLLPEKYYPFNLLD